MDIIGNQKTLKLLDRIAATGKIANAYLFLGPEGVGKFTVALRFAKKVVGSAPENSSRVDSDLIIIKPEVEEKKGVLKKLDIKVETIRELQHKLSLTSTGGTYKAVIIDNAERLNKTAQNALLKTLEEPNEKVVLVLVAQNEKKLLPTIISRCQKIKFGLVGDFEMEKIIPLSHPDRRQLIFWALGRPGVANNLVADPESLVYRQIILREFSKIFTNNLSERLSLAESWSKDLGVLQGRLDLWQVILRESMLGRDPGIRISPDVALRLSEEISESTRIMKETNSNPRLVMENLLLKFQK